MQVLLSGFHALLFMQLMMAVPLCEGTTIITEDGNRKVPKESVCGKPFFKPVFKTKDRAGNRISNGVEAKMYSHPWQALIHVEDPLIFKFCGGSLMHYKQENLSDLVLTAAHCLIDSGMPYQDGIWADAKDFTYLYWLIDHQVFEHRFLDVRSSVFRRRQEGYVINMGALKAESAAAFPQSSFVQTGFLLLRLTLLILRKRYQKKRTAWQKVKSFFSRLFKRYDGPPLVDVNSVTVFLGLHDYKWPSLAMRRLKVTALLARDFNFEDVTEDIALIKLEKDVAYSTVIQGICLPAENEDLPPPESPCLVTGWGRLHSGQYGTKLRQFQTYIVHGKVSNPYFQERLMICTRSETNNTGARKGDSGGPLVCLRNNTFVIYGVLSFGFEESCSDLKDRQAFTKVTRYLSWLKKAAAKLHT